MKNLFKYLMITACALGLSGTLKAQDHIIGSNQNPRTKATLKIHNLAYVEKSTDNAIRNAYGWIESIDSINLTSSSLLNGDSITMLYGDVPGILKEIIVEPTIGTAYTSGSTDSILVYSVVNDTSIKAFMLVDTLFNSHTPKTQLGYVTSDSDGSNCNIYLKIPAGKLSGGTHSYTVLYKYAYKP